MEYRSLGRTGVQVSSICLGCWNFGGKTSPEDAHKIIARALEQDVNFLDTANSYQKGRSEEITGEALKRSGKRDRLILATKVHFRVDDDPNSFGNSRRHIIEQCEASLRRLQTDHIDLYQVHRPQPSIPIDETLRALDDLVRSGKVRYIGSSTFAAWQVVESLWVSKELSLNRFVCEQTPYNILDRRVERELIPMARTYGLGLILWSPLAGGLLSGKYTRDEAPPSGSRFSDFEDNVTWKRRMSTRAFDVTEGLESLAETKGCTMSQLALAWCMAQPGVTCPIIGPRTMEQFEDNLAAMEVTITDEDLAQIDEIIPPGEMASPFYRVDFGPHSYRW